MGIMGIKGEQTIISCTQHVLISQNLCHYFKIVFTLGLYSKQVHHLHRHRIEFYLLNLAIIIEILHFHQTQAIFSREIQNSNNYSCGNHFFKVLVQIHYSRTRMWGIQRRGLSHFGPSQLYIHKWSTFSDYQNLSCTNLLHQFLTIRCL